MIGLKAIYFIEEAHLISEDTCRLTVKEWNPYTKQMKAKKRRQNPFLSVPAVFKPKFEEI